MVIVENILEVKEYIENVKVVVLDLDDTLYSEKDYVRSGYHEIGKILTNVSDCEQKLWDLFLLGEPAVDKLLLNENIYTEELKEKCMRVYRSHMPEIKLYDEAYELIRFIKSKGLLLGIITDGRPEGQNLKLEALGLKSLVDYYIITDELGGIEYRKPNPTAFVLMKKVLSCKTDETIDYTDICYVGDNIRKDFVAPKELGMQYIWFKNPDGLYI